MTHGSEMDDKGSTVEVLKRLLSRIEARGGESSARQEGFVGGDQPAYSEGVTTGERARFASGHRGGVIIRLLAAARQVETARGTSLPAESWEVSSTTCAVLKPGSSKCYPSWRRRCELLPYRRSCEGLHHHKLTGRKVIPT